MKKFVVGTLCAAVMLGSLSLPVAVGAQSTTDRTAMLAQIEQLLKLVETLQAQLKAAQGDLADAIKSGLEEGMEDDDIKKVQELLASDPTLYPSGRVTGYFGPMTGAALKRFQERYELEVTGKLDEATREALSALRKERVQGRIPPGLLQSSEAKDRVREKLKEKWGDCDFTRPLREQKCERVKDRQGSDDKDDDEDDDSLSDAQKARLAIVRAEARLEALERVLDRREYSRNIAQLLVNKAQDRLREARSKLRLAQAALITNPDKAEELAKAAEELLEEGAEAVDKEAEISAAAKAVASEEDEDEDDDDEDENES